MSEGRGVIRFPRRPHTAAVVPAPIEDHRLQFVEHDGRLYALRNLLTRLPMVLRQELSAAPSHHGQDAWDLVVCRWPATAARIVADTGAMPIVV